LSDALVALLIESVDKGRESDGKEERDRAYIPDRVTNTTPPGTPDHHAEEEEEEEEEGEEEEEESKEEVVVSCVDDDFEESTSTVELDLKLNPISLTLLTFTCDTDTPIELSLFSSNKEFKSVLFVRFISVLIPSGSSLMSVSL
jgi:hypothetical protein